MKIIKNNKKIRIGIIFLLIIGILSLSVISMNQNENTITTNAESASNKKIGWGIKRNDKHEQPDLGTQNKKILEENGGIALGNPEKKYIYLTFDEGYEAGYTPKILETLKNNEVKATFFITAHFVNTQPELVQQMINEGHIIGNHTPIFLMSGSIVWKIIILFQTNKWIKQNVRAIAYLGQVKIKF